MIRLARIGFLLIFLLLAPSQSASPAQLPSATPSPQLCTVEGMVVSATTGQALHKILLSLYNQHPVPAIVNSANSRPQRYSAVSDDAGHFAFSSVSPGEYRLMGYGIGYPRKFYSKFRNHGGATTLRLAPGEDLKNIVFSLEPGVVVTGKVVDEDGDPFARVSVQAFAEFYTRAGVQHHFVGRALTNDLGEYRIWGLKLGKFLLYASPMYAHGSVGGGVYMSEFYPGTTDPSQATPIESHPGDVLTGMDFTLTAAQPARISGQVIDGTTGQPEDAVNLFLRPAFGETVGFYGMNRTLEWGAQGHFRMTRMAPGSWVLIAEAQSGQTWLSAQVPVNLSSGDNLSGLRVTLMPPIELSGRISADPSPALKLSMLTVLLHPETSNAMQDIGFANPKPDGSFTVQNTSAGKYRITVQGFPPQYYLKSATLDGADVLENGLTLTAGEPPGTLRLFLSLDGGSIQGTVLDADGKPVADAVVALIPDAAHRDRADLYSNVRTNSMGQFTMLGLAPGDYKLFAWDDLEHHSVEDPDFIRFFEDRGKEVEVQARAQQQIQLQVIPASAMPLQ
jgi:protocatechuate 3,4-dioxygenase beta subunit